MPAAAAASPAAGSALCIWTTRVEVGDRCKRETIPGEEKEGGGGDSNIRFSRANLERAVLRAKERREERRHACRCVGVPRRGCNEFVNEVARGLLIARAPIDPSRRAPRKDKRKKNLGAKFIEAKYTNNFARYILRARFENITVKYVRV